MTGADGVYTYTTTVGEYDTNDEGVLPAEFKFAINDAWTHSFGLAEGGVVENGVEGFDFNTKTGAKMTITWTEPSASYILGDVDDNLVVNSVDSTLIQRYDAQMSIDPYTEFIMRGDVNGDGEVDILDATLIQRYDAEMTVKFPIGEYVNP